MRHMREDSNFAPRPDLPTDEIKKKPFLFTWRQVVIFIILFILMLAGITIVEMAAKASREAELQKRETAEDFCLTKGLNRTRAELDNCIEVSLILSESLGAGVPPRGTTARIIIEAGVPAELVRKMAENGAFGQ